MPLTNETLNLLRSDDLLALSFELVNLHLDAGEGRVPRLVRVQAAQPAFIIAHFPPQHIVEEAFSEDPFSPRAPVIGSVLAGSSRLVFKVPDNRDEIPFTLKSLLAWHEFEPALAPAALPIDATAGPEITDPSTLPTPVTAIEVPYRLLLSPVGSPGWVHTLDGAVTHDGRTELWHTRLGTRQADTVDESSEFLLRAIWSPDVKTPGGAQFNATLTSENRVEIARLSADFSIQPQLMKLFGKLQSLFSTGALGPDAQRDFAQKLLPLLPRLLAYRPNPIRAERLILSALGGWLHSQGSWDFPDIPLSLQPFSSIKPFGLQQWRHIGAMGRDQYVRIVQQGFLFPFGHRASIITTSERKFKRAPSGETAAYLTQHKILVVQEPEKDYQALSGAYASLHGEGGEMPLRRLRITTLITPNLSNLSDGTIFVPEVHSAPFRFAMVAEDWEHQRVDFTMPLVFVPSENIGDLTAAQRDFAAVRDADLRGQKIAFANSPDKPGTTTLPTTRLSFSVVSTATGLKIGKLTPGHPPFLPALESAEVSIPAVDRLSSSPGAAVIVFAEKYLENGVVASPSQIFATLPASKPLGFAADKAGGLVAPNMAVDGLSRELGPVSNVQDVIKGRFDPKKVFGDVKLLGGITLFTILEPVISGTDPPLASQVPKLLTTQLPEATKTTLDWHPKIRKIKDIIETDEDTSISVNTTLTTPLKGGEPTFIVTGTLTNFALNLPASPPLIHISFKKLSFQSRNGSKMDLKAEGIDVTFQDALSFVDTLAKILPSKGFSDGPHVDVTPAGITTGYSLGIPSAGVGAFSLENIALSAGLFLPFFDEPAGLRLAFSERYHPFLVTLSLIGGGGYFAIVIDTKGVKQLEGCLELGGNITVDLLIVSANVHVMAGFYFGMIDSTFSFSAYLRVGGSVEVLGIVGISIDIYVGLSFTLSFSTSSPSFISGRGSLTVGAHLLVFSKAITLSVEKRFDVPQLDPSFDDMVTPIDWEHYCRAFA